MVAELGIAKNDPLFLVMMAMKSMEVAVEKVPERIALQDAQFKATATQLNEKIVELEAFTSGLVSIAETLDTRLKSQIPRSARHSGLLMKELVTAVLVALVAGTIFGRPLIGKLFSSACQTFPGLCEVER